MKIKMPGKKEPEEREEKNPFNLNSEIIKSVQEEQNQKFFPETVFEETNPEDARNLIYPVQRRPFIRGIVAPPEYSLVVRKNGKFTKTLRSGKVRIRRGVFAKNEVFCVYSADIFHRLQFLIGSRFRNIGVQANISFSYKIADPQKGMQQDVFKRDGFLRPFVVETVQQVVNDYTSEKNIDNLSSFNENDYKEIKDKLSKKFLDYFQGIGFELKSLDFYTIPSEFETRTFYANRITNLARQLLDSENSLYLALITRTGQLNMLQTTSRQEIEEKETGHQIQLKKMIFDYDLKALEEKRKKLQDLEKVALSEDKPYNKALALALCYLYLRTDGIIDKETRGYIEKNIEEIIRTGIDDVKAENILKGVEHISDALKNPTLRINIGTPPLENLLSEVSDLVSRNKGSVK